MNGNSKKNYYVITIDREKNVVKRELVSGWVNALNKVAENEMKARNCGWRTYLPEDRYVFPRYIKKYRGMSFIMSFSMVKGKRERGGRYYYTYIKSA